MQAITKNGVCVFIFDDTKTVVLLQNKTVVYNSDGSVDLYIADCNTTNSKIFEISGHPEDLLGNNYLFDGTTWSLNSSFD